MATPPNPYSNLHFASHVDWIHVDQTLLQKINAIAKRRGDIVDVFSGYRSTAYNKSVGGAEHSLHTQGRAIDAYVNGAPIGEAWPMSVFDKAGLRSGNQPNFFNGKPDPEHVDLGFNGSTDTTAQSPVTSYAPPDTTPPDNSQDGANVVLPGDGSASIGPAIGANVIAPNDGTSPFQPTNLPPRFQTWQMLSALPGASPDTLKMSQLAGYEDPNAQP